MKAIILCLFAVAICLADETKTKRNAAFNPYLKRISPYAARRQAWDCHPGCRKFCLPSCKRSCCFGAPNYRPQMFQQLIQYQSNIDNPPQLPPACPANCNPSCYPSCDAGCCALQPQVQASAYGTSAGCSRACAPSYSPACCHSRPIGLHSLPMIPGAPMTAEDKPSAPGPAPAPASAPKPKSILFEKKQDGKLCIRKCLNLCNPKCRFECCLPTHLHFDDDPPLPPKVQHNDPPPKVEHPAIPPKIVDRKTEQLKTKLRDPQYIHPIAMPQRARFPSLYRATPPPRRPMPCQGQRQRRPGQPCMVPTTSPFEATTDPFGEMTEPFGMTDIPFPSTQSYYPQATPGACPSSCPQSCAPSCSPACCQTQVIPLPPISFVPGYAGSPGLSPLGQASTTCAAGCASACAPACSQSCCQQFPQVVHVPPASSVPPLPGPPSPGLSPLGQASTCPGMCPNSCAPGCTRQCCIAPQVVHVPPVHMAPHPPVHLAAAHPIAVPVAPMHSGSPGLKPLGMASTCPGQCPNICAPTCATSCCAAPAPPPPQLTCPSPNCPNACAPKCKPSCCINNDQPLPSNWDRRSFIQRLWGRK